MYVYEIAEWVGTRRVHGGTWTSNVQAEEREGSVSLLPRVIEHYPASPAGWQRMAEPIRQSQVWQDHELLGPALRITPGADVLSVCGAGCNVLSMLLMEPRSIVAIDDNPAQTALLELKLACLARLSHPESVAFLGARGAVDRTATYERLRYALSPEACAYWDEHPHEIEDGVLCSGSHDRHVRAFVDEFVATMVDPVALAAFLSLASPEDQRVAFERDLSALQEPARRWFGQKRLAGWALDGLHCRNSAHVDAGELFWSRLTEVATTLPARGNFYLEWLLTGRYRSLAAGPPFLRPDNFERLRALAGKVTVVRGSVAEFMATQPPESFDAIDLADALEHLPESDVTEVLSALGPRLRPTGRVMFWNLFGSHSACGDPAAVRDLRPLAHAGSELSGRDRSPFSTGFDVWAPLARELSVV